MSTLISVDLDDLSCYHQIHDLEPPSAEMAGVVLERCLPRFLELFAELDVRATFFVIGRDLERDLDSGGVGAKLLRRALAAGHELGNHSYAHAYDMHTWSSADIARDIKRCDALLRTIGAQPLGFRAPGYVHHKRMLQQVAGLGYRYDSSALPSPPYYLAKLGVMGWMRLRGKRSASSLSGATTFLGGTRPRYLSDVGLWEVPVSASPTLRLPVVGTALLSGPRRISDLLRAQVERMDYAHIELHGLDLADPDEDGYAQALVDKQPELKVSFEDRCKRLGTLLAARGSGGPILPALG